MVSVPRTTWNLEESRVANADDWASVIGEIYAPITVEESSQAFSGQIRNTGTDGVQISRLSIGKHRSHRLARDIRKHETPKLVLCLQLSGTGRVHQQNSDVVLNPGDMTVYSTTVPYELIFDTQAEVIGVVVPWGSLAQAPMAAHHLAARIFPAADPVSRAVFNAITAIEPELLEMPLDTRRRLVRNVVEMMSTLCLAHIEGILTQRQGLGKTDRLSQALAYIEDHLADPDLTLTTIASNTFVSIRSLQQRARETGFGLADWIRERRLEQCKADLIEYPDRSIAFVASSWGLTNATHFSQIFKYQFGMTPREYRASSRADYARIS